MRISDWSSDVCSSDLRREREPGTMDGPDTKWRNGPRTALAHARLSGVTVRDGTIETCASPNGRGQQPFTPERCLSAPGREFPALPADRDRKSTRLNSSH